MEVARILKYAILVLLILLAILSVTYKFDDCSLCSFEINKTKYSAQGMANIYYNKCIYEKIKPYSELVPVWPSQANLSEQK